MRQGPQLLHLDVVFQDGIPHGQSARVVDPHVAARGFQQPRKFVRQFAGKGGLAQRAVEHENAGRAANGQGRVVEFGDGVRHFVLDPAVVVLAFVLSGRSNTITVDVDC